MEVPLAHTTRTTTTLLFALLALPAALAAQEAPAAWETRPFGRLFEEVWQTVRDDFFDPDLAGVDWPGARQRYGPRAAAAGSLEEAVAIINEMLAELATSHTRLFAPSEPELHQLLGIFVSGALGGEIRARYPGGEVSYTGIGIATAEAGGGTFITAVLDGSPAAEAGLLRGDRILAADGEPFSPLGSFRGKEGTPVRLTVERQPPPAPAVDVEVTPAHLRPAELFLEAMRQSVRVIDAGGVRIGYIHAWSYAGRQYHDLLEEEVSIGGLADADALILDLRGGWGGAGPDYLNLFNRRVPVLEQVGRDGTVTTFDPQWRRPAALLVDGGTRSGKEVLAWGFQAYGLGPVVGSRTAGAVVAGRPYLLSHGCVLFLAVADVRVDGRRLEGTGVAPDVAVPRPLEHSAGSDPQLERALEVLRERGRRERGHADPG